MICWTHRTMIVPADHADLARTLCATLAGPAGEGMFSTALSASGFCPATHYISAGLIEDTFAALLPLQSADAATPGDAATTHALAQMAGMDVAQSEIAALFGAVTVTESGPIATMAALGLQLCSRVDDEASSDRP